MQKNLILLLLVSVGLFTSCNQDETPRRAILVTGNTPFTTTWVFISDSEGTPLDYEMLPDEGTVALEIPNELKEEVVTLNFILLRSSVIQEKDLISYAEIAPGSYTFSTPEEPFHFPGFAWLTVENASNDIALTLGGQSYHQSITGNEFQLNLISSEVSKALVTGVDKTNHEGRSRIFTVIPDIKLTFDYQDFSALDRTSIEVSGDAYDVTQLCLIDGKEFLMRQSVMTLSDNEPEEVSLYHSAMFDSYFTSLTVREEAQSYTNTYEGPTLPMSFDPLDASIFVGQQDDSRITANLTGYGDVVQVEYIYEEHIVHGPVYLNTRTYYLPFKNSISFKHPQIPEDLRRTLDTFAFGSVKRVSLIDYETFDNYQSFANFRLKDNGVYKDIRSNSRGVSKDLQ